MFQFFKYLQFFVLLTGSASLWASPSNEPSSLQEKVFRLRLGGDPETLDWNRSHTIEEIYLIPNLMEGLLEIDRDLKIRPRLAQSYQVSADGRVITFYLRPGVLWQDGVPLKAADFVYGWRRLLSPLTAAPYAYLLFDVQGAKDFHDGKIRDFSNVGVRAIDDRRLEVRLNEAVPEWLYLPSFWPLFPVRQDVVEKYGVAWASPGKIVTLGAYTLDSREIGSQVVLRPNPKYWAKRGNLSRIEAMVIQDDAAALALFESGKLDLLKDLPPHQISQLEKRAELKFMPYLATVYLGFRVDKYPASLELVRRAVAHALDRAAIASAMGGKVEPAAGLIHPRLMSGIKRKPLGVAFDPLRARSMLRMAGIDPSELDLELLVQTSDRSRKIGELVRDQLKKNLGVSIKLQAYEHKTFRSQLDLQAFPVFQLQWSADYPDPTSFLNVFSANSGHNRTGWINPSYSRILAEARRSRQPRDRLQAYDSAERLLVEKDVAIVPLFHSAISALISKRSRGVDLNSLNFIYLREVSVD